MKIAYIVSQFPKLSETFILREMEAMRLRGEEILVVSLRKSTEPIRHPDVERFLDALIVAPGPLASSAALLAALARRPLRVLKLLARVMSAHARSPALLARALMVLPAGAAIARRLAAEGVEHVHAHWATWPAQAAWTARELEGIPYSMTAHAHDIFLPNPMLPDKVAGSAFTATISAFNRRWIEERCGARAEGRVEIVRCGVPLAAYPFRPPREGAGARVVSVGRLVDYKGFPVLVEAMALLKAAGRDVRCVLVGDGPQRERILGLIRARGLEGEVTLTGALTLEEVREELSGAAVCVLASERGRDGQMDGVPVVLMEAMALGVPSVATRISGIPEIVEDGVTGLLVEPGEPEALARAVARILDDPALARRLAEAGRARIERDYDATANADSLRALIRRAAGREGWPWRSSGSSPPSSSGRSSRSRCCSGSWRCSSGSARRPTRGTGRAFP